MSRPSLIFPQLAHIPDFFSSRMSPTLISFSGCAHRCFFSQVAHVADFSPGYTRRWFIFPGRTISSLTPFQIVPVDDCFFTGRASRKICFMLLLSLLFFFQVLPKNESFASSHESFADFFFRLRPSLIFFTVSARCSQFSQVAPVVDLYFRLRTSLTLSPGRARRWFFPRLRRSRIFFGSHEFSSQIADIAGFSNLCGTLIFCASSSSHESVADFFFRLRPSLTFFTCRGHRWLLFQVAPVADFFLGSEQRWLSPRLCMSLTSFSVCAHGWFFTGFRMSLFFQVAQVVRWLFFSGCARRWHFSQVAAIADFFSRLRPTLTSTSGCAHRWFFPLSFLPGTRSHKFVADFYFRLRTLLIFSQVAPVADFSPDCARRWILFHRSRPSLNFFFMLRSSLQIVTIDDFFARLRSQLEVPESEVAPFAVFFPSCAGRRLFWQLARVRHWLRFRLRPSLTFFTGRAQRWLLFQVAHIVDFFTRSFPLLIFPRLCTSLIFFSWSHDSVADFFFRLCPSLTIFSQVATVANFFSCCSCRS